MSDYKLSPRQRREAEAVLESMVGGGGDPEPYAFELVALRARVEELEGQLEDMKHGVQAVGGLSELLSDATAKRVEVLEGALADIRYVDPLESGPKTADELLDVIRRMANMARAALAGGGKEGAAANRGAS